MSKTCEHNVSWHDECIACVKQSKDALHKQVVALKAENIALKRLLRVYYRLHDAASEIAGWGWKYTQLNKKMENCASAYNRHIAKYPANTVK